MAITFANLGASANPDINSSTNASSYSNTSWTPPTSGLIFLFVYNRKVGGGDIPTVSGNGITWVQIATILNGAHRLTLFGANASGSTAGVTTIDFGGVTQLGCIAMFAHADGVDLSGGVTAAFVQAPTGSGTGTSGSITLAAAGNAANRPIAAFVHAANEVTTPRTNWTEFDDLSGSGPVRGGETQVRSDAFETTASASWATSSAWVGIAAELKAAGVGGTFTKTHSVDALIALDVRQAHFRIRDDSSGLNADTGWVAALDTNSTMDAEKVFRIRFELESRSPAASKQYKLQYRRNSGAWTDLPVNTASPPTSVDPAEIVDSSQFLNQDTTTNILTGSSLTFVTGYGLESLTSPAISLDNQHTELEWALRIRLSWGNASGFGRNAAGDTFEFRVVYSDGTTLNGYTNTPTITLTVPDYLIGGTFVETPKRIGPWADANGNLYVFVEFAETNSRGCMLKSTDGGKTWAEVDGANRPTSNDWESMDGQVVGSTIHLASFHGTSTVRYHTFRMSTDGTNPDTWGIKDELVNTAASAPSDQSVSLVVRSNGTVVCAYNTDSANRVGYRIRSTGGVWSAETIVDSQSATSFTDVLLVLGASDVTHVFYKDDTNSLVYHRTISASDVLSARQQVNTALVPQQKPITSGVYYDNAGTEVVAICYRRSGTLLLLENRLHNGTVQGERDISDQAIAANRGGSQAPQGLIALDSATKTVWGAYADNTNFDLWVDKSVNGGAWGTDVQVADVVSVDNLSGNIITHSSANGGKKVFAFYIDNGSNSFTGAVRYVEYAVSSSATKQHSVDALLKKVSQVSHSVDAVIAARGTTAHQVDASVRKTSSSSSSVDASIQKRQSLTSSVDASIKSSASSSYSADALIKFAGTRAHSVDTLLRATATRTHGLDTLLKATATKGHNVDALLKTTATKVHSVDASIRKSIAVGSSLDAVLQKTQSVSHAVDALIRVTSTRAQSADASIKRTSTQAHGLDVLIKATSTQPQSVDALVKATQTRAHNVDALIRLTATQVHSEDAIVKATLTRDHGSDALVKKVQSVSASVDASISSGTQTKTHSVDAVVLKTQTQVHSVDALLLKAQTRTSSVDAAVKKVQAQTHSTDALALKAQTRVQSVDALIKKALTVAQSANSLVAKTSSVSHSVDATIRKTGTQSHAIDALTRKTLTVTTNADAVIRRSSTVASSADCLIKQVASRDSSVDSLIRKTQTQASSLDALVRKAQTQVHSLDALLKKALDRNNSIDALLRKTLTAVHSSDCIISSKSTIASNVDALLKATTTKTHGVDALLKATATKAGGVDASVSKASSVSHSVDVALKRSAQETHSVDASIRSTRTASCSVDAYISSAGKASHLTDSLISKRSTVSSGADAVVSAATSRTTSVDALVRKTNQNQSHVDCLVLKVSSVQSSVDVVARRTSTLSSSVDATVLVKGRTASASVDALLKKASSVNFSVDSVLMKVGSSVVSVDALLRRTATEAHSTDASLLAVQTKEASVDALISVRRSESASADAYLLRSTRIAHSLDSLIFSSGRTVLASVDALVTKRLIVTTDTDGGPSGSIGYSSSQTSMPDVDYGGGVPG